MGDGKFCEFLLYVSIILWNGAVMVVFRTDPCGIICILITYAVISYADYVVVRHLVIPSMSES